MKAEKIETKIPGCYIIKLTSFKDERGAFIKLFHNEVFEKLGLASDFKEEYYSSSKKGVLRGLHFQLPPYDHVKCIFCLKGAIIDAVVDLRIDSPTYREHLLFELKDSDPQLIYIPKGLAHGFYVLEDDTLFLNKTTTVFHGESDTGIKWDSCGIKWPDKRPILSEKDQNLITLNDFQSPFHI